ncbi:DUF5908 family protein [Mucilaginibacter sp. SG564]|uniref:DUF5908 family protein n=1 Tax=unclassified Mucilaginibacter TaxID=2617802 RepID=UPI001554CF0A|nr:DUF5908 family protein [Mucilaginibacter sp. SG564]NOW93900.1 hypothetical protein [Mucilaginibacter sp. SG564]
MPVEIRELQIVTTITEGGNTGGNTTPSSAGATNSEDIIAKCVEQVLEILKEKTDR